MEIHDCVGHVVQMGSQQLPDSTGPVTGLSLAVFLIIFSMILYRRVRQGIRNLRNDEWGFYT